MTTAHDPRRRGRAVARLVLLAGALATLVACGQARAVPRADLEARVSTAMTPQGDGVLQAAYCVTGLDAVVGDTAKCGVTLDGTEVAVNASVGAVAGDEVDVELVPQMHQLHLEATVDELVAPHQATLTTCSQALDGVEGTVQGCSATLLPSEDADDAEPVIVPVEVTVTEVDGAAITIAAVPVMLEDDVAARVTDLLGERGSEPDDVRCPELRGVPDESVVCTADLGGREREVRVRVAEVDGVLIEVALVGGSTSRS